MSSTVKRGASDSAALPKSMHPIFLNPITAVSPEDMDRFEKQQLPEVGLQRIVIKRVGWVESVHMSCTVALWHSFAHTKTCEALQGTSLIERPRCIHDYRRTTRSNGLE